MSIKNLIIKQDDLTHQGIKALLARHMDFMRSQSPADSVHALDIEGLQHASIQFWSAWQGDALMGCVALKTLDKTLGEIKSMHVTQASRGMGLGKILCQHVINEAQSQGLSELSLETGSTEGFWPALALYESMGFCDCPPFGGYKPDPFSRFMTKKL